MNQGESTMKKAVIRIAALALTVFLALGSVCASADSGDWTCQTCGQPGNTGNFCSNCGAARPSADWTCQTCGQPGNTGNFCAECGARKPEQQTSDGWICPSCQAQNKGKFCSECGTAKPAGEPLYKCDKCGWEPEDPHHPPKFCPQCGDPFNEADIKQ